VPWPLHLLTHWSAGTILVAQTLTFVLIAGIASYPAPRHRVVPSSIAGAARGGDLPEGPIGAARRAGTLLARHCPPAPGDRNELPDRVVVI
jgi:uncharacterized membrane protein